MVPQSEEEHFSLFLHHKKEHYTTVFKSLKNQILQTNHFNETRLEFL